MGDFWIKIVELINYGLGWLKTNFPVILEYLKNIALTLGGGSLVIGLIKMIMLFKRNKSEVEKALKELKEELETERTANKTKDDLILAFIELSSKTNSEAKALKPDAKDEYAKLYAAVVSNKSMVNNTTKDVKTIVNEISSQISQVKVEEVKETIVEPIVETIKEKALQTVDDLKGVLLK